MNGLKTHSSVTSHSSSPNNVSCQYECREDKPLVVAINSLQRHPYEQHHVLPSPSFCYLKFYRLLDRETHPEFDDSSCSER